MERRGFMAMMGGGAEKAAASLGVTPVVIEVRAADYERTFASMMAGHATALMVMSSTQLNRDRARIIALAAQHRMLRDLSVA